MKKISAEMAIFHQGGVGVAILPLPFEPVSYHMDEKNFIIRAKNDGRFYFPHSPEFVKAVNRESNVLIAEMTGTRITRETEIVSV